MTRMRGHDTSPGWINRKFVSIERRLRELSALPAGSTVVRTVNKDVSGISLPTDWTTMAGGPTVNIPPGWTAGDFILMVSAGDTFVTTGNLSVQPVVSFVRSSSEEEYGGSAINSGNSSVGVANSFWAARFTLATYTSDVPTQLRFSARVVRGGDELPDNGTWHVNALLTFRRLG